MLGVCSLLPDAVFLFAALFNALLPPLSTRLNSVGNVCGGLLPLVATLLLLATGRGLLARRPWARRGAMLFPPLAALLIVPWAYWPLVPYYPLSLAGYLAAVTLGGALLCYLLSRPAVKSAFQPQRPLNWEWVEKQRKRRRVAVR